MVQAPEWRGKPVWALVWVLTLLAFAITPGAADGYVYWANGASQGSIGRANLDGTAANRNFITGASLPSGVAVDGGYVYWANTGTNTIGRATLDGSGANQAFIVGATSPCGVAVDGAHVYWGNEGGSGHSIGRANLDGTDVNQNFIVGDSSVCGVAVNTSTLFWANQGTNYIGSANLGGTGANQRLIQALFTPGGPALNRTNLYWTERLPTPPDADNLFSVARAKLDGSQVSHRFIVTKGGACGAAATDTRVYWAEAITHTIGQATVAGQAVNTRLITGAGLPCGVTVDGLGPPPAPLLSAQRASPRAFRARSRGPSLTRRAPIGTTISYGVSLDAVTRVSVLRPTVGHRSGRSCVPGRRPSQRSRCTRLRNIGSFSHADRAGNVVLRFSGRVRGRKLEPGPYVLDLRARADGRSGPSARLAITIVR